MEGGIYQKQKRPLNDAAQQRTLLKSLIFMQFKDCTNFLNQCDNKKQ